MAGIFATVIGMEADKDYKERTIVQALKNVRTSNTNIRIQPVGNGLGYLVVENKKSKAAAEEAFIKILGEYLALGGREYEVSDLPEDAPAPAMAYLTNDQAKVAPPAPPSEWVVAPELIEKARRLRKLGL